MIDAAVHVAADTIDVNDAVQMEWMEWMAVGEPVNAVDVDELASQVVSMRACKVVSITGGCRLYAVPPVPDAVTVKLTRL